MKVLAAVEYDPGTVATFPFGSVIAMTPLDTTNLRLTFTVPASGAVQVRIAVPGLVGGNRPLQPLLGVMEGAAVILRVAPQGGLPRTIAVLGNSGEISGVITGLTPGDSKTWDAAYGIETSDTVGNSMRCGGPNDTTAGNAWGALSFEIFEA